MTDQTIISVVTIPKTKYSYWAPATYRPTLRQRDGIFTWKRVTLYKEWEASTQGKACRHAKELSVTMRIPYRPGIKSGVPVQGAYALNQGGYALVIPDERGMVVVVDRPSRMSDGTACSHAMEVRLHVGSCTAPAEWSAMYYNAEWGTPAFRSVAPWLTVFQAGQLHALLRLGMVGPHLDPLQPVEEEAP
jgi:hypothetical protein